MTSDILWYNSSTGESQIWFMDGSKLSDRATVVYADGQPADGQPALIGPPFSIVGTGDFDGSGQACILWYNSSTGESQIWFMDSSKLIGRATVVYADGQPADGQPALIGPPFSIVGVGDFDRNKKSDILWYNSSTGESQIWFMDGSKLIGRATVVYADGQPTDGQPALIGPPFSIVGVGDFDGNGQADILWYNSSTGESQIWFMDGSKLIGRATVVYADGQPTDGQPALIGPPFSIVGVGDFDGNNKADILWHNSSTGESQIWFMDRSKLIGRATVVDADGTPALIGPPFSIVGVEVFRPHPERPANPTNLRVTNVADREISVTWVDHSDNEDGFRVQFQGKRAGQSDHTGTKTVGPNVASAVLGGLRSGYDYQINVLAFNAAGDSPQSNTVEATTPARTIAVSKQGVGASTVLVITGDGFTPGSRVVLKVTNPDLSGPQFAETAGGDGKFVSPHSFPCVSGRTFTVTAYEDADPLGTFANAVVTTCP